MYREDHLHPGFTKHVLDITLPDGTIVRTATHHFFGLEPEGSKPHTHPFDIESKIVFGEYIEDIYYPLADGKWWRQRLHRKKGDNIFISADTIHKLVALPTEVCITQVVQSEPYREIKFWDFDPTKEVAAP